MPVHARSSLTLWLFTLFSLIIVMIVLGAVVRLTDSGLSMVEWKVILGAIPPLNGEGWELAFSKYKQFPEFKVLSAMTLSEFKFIYAMEYGHRLLGRIIGLVFLFPFIYFVFNRQIDRRDRVRLLTLFLLGGIQGGIGWYMVKSGLVNEPRVSQYRLALHFGMALIILSLTWWYALAYHFDAFKKQITTQHSLLGGLTVITLVIVGTQLISGAFVAGLDAGHVSPTFPKMMGRWVPEPVFTTLMADYLNNPVVVHFLHRLGAVIASFFIVIVAVLARKRRRPIRRIGRLLVAILGLQVALGISTIVYFVPTSIAAMHQAVGLALWCSLLYLLFQLRFGNALYDLSRK